MQAVVEDLNFYNSANVHISPVFSQHMQFRRLYMYSDFAGPYHKNTDGFNPSSSSDISLTDSYIHNGDDCIAVKSGKCEPPPSPPISNQESARGHSWIALDAVALCFC